jgi:hypothetical protein
VRAIPGAIIGFDMTAVLALARASGVSEALVYEFMPALEAVLIEAHNRDPEDNGREAGISPDQG